MDPVSQGVLGASLPQVVSRREQVLAAGLLGMLAGMAPDLDVLIRSSTDPLLFLEYHRQFTHSLIFIPFGGFLCALVLHPLIGRRFGLSFTQSALFCLCGYATHALLDACTTYGTQLLWPFSDARIAWNTISIVDPLFTVPLLVGVIAAAIKKQPRYAQCALLWALVYLAVGVWQRNQAMEIGAGLAASRGHTPLRLEAKPSFGNVLLWKTVYEVDGQFYVDAVRLGPGAALGVADPVVYLGRSVPRLVLARDLPWLDLDSQQAKDVERFAWFSNDYVAYDPARPDTVMDMRYSLLPNEVAPLWSLKLSRTASPQAHAQYHVHRERDRNTLSRFWRMLAGKPLG